MIMARVIKYLFIVLVVIVALFTVFLLTFDLNRYKDDIVHAVETRTGREVSITGNIGLGLSLLPTLVIEDASLGNAPWGTRPAMLTIRRFEAEIDLLPLLSGDIRINRFILNNPELFLETDKQGRGNWILSGAARSKKKPSAGKNKGGVPPPLSIRKLIVKDAQVTYRDGRTGRSSSLRIPELALVTEGSKAPMKLQLEAEYDKKLLRLNGTIGSLDNLLQNRPYKVNLGGSLDAVDMSLQGDLKQPLTARGLALQLTLGADSLADLPAGMSLPKVGPLSLSASVTDPKPGFYRLKPFKLTLGDSELGGEVSLDVNGERPALSASLKAELLDLKPFQPEQEKSKKGPLFSKEALPVDALHKVDADMDMDVTAKEVLTRSLPLRDFKLGVHLNNGRLKLQPLSAVALDGTLTGNVAVIPAGSKSVNLQMNLGIKGLKPGLLPKLKNKIQGAASDVSIVASGNGGSVAAIMGSLNGSLLIQVGKGKMEKTALNMAGANLLMQTLSLLGPKSDKSGMADLQCAVVAFRIKNGLAVSDRGIAMETSRMTVVGGGTVNLRTEELDLGMQPHPREGLGINASEFVELVRLGGTLSNPVPKPATLAAMKSAATVGAAVATGGISLLAGGLFERATADEHPCKTALAFAVGGAKAEPAASGTSGTATEQTGEKKKQEGPGDKVKGIFKGLFGD
jgi:uncharacterized protein involved in outer membrane biogenesis